MGDDELAEGAGIPAVGQIVHVACTDGGSVAYRCTEVKHEATGIWTYTLEPARGSTDSAVTLR